MHYNYYNIQYSLLGSSDSELQRKNGALTFFIKSGELYRFLPYTAYTHHKLRVHNLFNQLIYTQQELFKPLTSAHHIPSACWTVVNSGSAGSTDKMSLLTLEHLRLSCEPLVTNRTLGYSPGDVVGVGSAHQAQDVG